MRLRLLRHLGDHFGPMLLIDITADDISAYQAARNAEGAANKTVNNELGALRAILRKHRLWATLQPDVERARDREDAGKALSLDEETRLLAACEASRSRTLQPAVVLALHTGLRRGELLALRWHQVSFERRVLTVGKSKTVAGGGRVVPLNGRAIETLKLWGGLFPDREPDHAVFPRDLVGVAGNDRIVHVVVEDPSVPIASLKEAWETAKQVSGVSCRWHDLRHTACTRLLEAGISLAIVARILGWSASTTVRMAQRYGHIGHEAQRDAMATLDGRPTPPKPSSIDGSVPASSAVH